MKTVLLSFFLFFIFISKCSIDIKQESDRSNKIYVDNHFNLNDTFKLYLPKWQYSFNESRKLYYENKNSDYDIKSLQEHKSTKDMIIIDNATLADITNQRDIQILDAIIKKEVLFEHNTFSINKIAYIYPDTKSLNHTIPKLISSSSRLKEYIDIKDTIIFKPKEIIFSYKPICIPTMSLMYVNNTSKQKIFILGVKTDLYQLNIFALKENSISNMTQYINSKITYPREIQSNTGISFQLIVLPDIIGEIKGNIYFDIIIDKKPSVIVYPITIIGINNLYQIKPFYYPNHQISKLLSIPLQIYNPHSTPLIIQETVNSFSSINLLWPDGKTAYRLNEPIKLQSKSKKTILHLNFYQESSGAEYGLLQLKTNKDTLIIPVLVKVNQLYLNPYPSYFNFGIISPFNDTFRRAIPFCLTNISKETIDIKGMYFQYDENAIEFINIDCFDNCSISPGKQREIGYIILNPTQALLNEGAQENKSVSGKIYIETNNDAHQFSEIDYEYFISASEIHMIKDTINVSMEDLNANNNNNTITINKTIIFPIEHSNVIQKNYNRNFELNDNLLYEYIQKENSKLNIILTIKNKDRFLKENTYQYFFPFYLNNNYYSFIPVIISDNLIDLLYCNDEINFYICKSKVKEKNSLYKSINSINDLNKRKITLDIGVISTNRSHHRYIVLINNNANPILVTLQNNNERITIDLLTKDNKILELPNILTIEPRSTTKLKIEIDPSTMETIEAKIVLKYPFTKVLSEIIIKGKIIKGTIGTTPSEIAFNSFLHPFQQYESITTLSSFNSTVMMTSIKSEDKQMLIHSINKELPPKLNIEIGNTSIKHSSSMKLNNNHILFFEDKYLTYRELYLWKSVYQRILNEEDKALESLLLIQANIGDYSINRTNCYHCDKVLVSSLFINYGQVQIGKTHEAYINITNTSNKPIVIQPMLANEDYLNSIDSNVSHKQYRDINNELSLFDCFFQNSTKSDRYTPFQYENLINSIIINQNLSVVTNENVVSKAELIKLLYENANDTIKNSFQNSKSILCKTSIISKADLFLRNNKELHQNLFSFDIEKEIGSIKQLTQNNLNDYKLQQIKPSKNIENRKHNQIIQALLSYINKKTYIIEESDNNSKASNAITQEIFLLNKKIEIIQPNQTITLGPIIYHPLSMGSINMTLLLKNNLTIITPIQIKGSSGTGIVKIFSNETEPFEVLSNYDITITKSTYEQYPNGKIIKQFLLVNSGNFPLTYTQISLANNQCKGNDITLLTCGSLYLPAFQTKLIQLSIELNFDFFNLFQTMIIKSYDGEERQIDIRVTIDNELLELNHHFFSFAIKEKRILPMMIAALISFVIYLCISNKEKTENGMITNRKLSIISNVIIMNQSNCINQQNLFIKSYRRFDNTFYEEVLAKMDEERIEYSIEDKEKKKKKRYVNKKKQKQKQKETKPQINANIIDTNKENENESKIERNRKPEQHYNTKVKDTFETDKAIYQFNCASKVNKDNRLDKYNLNIISNKGLKCGNLITNIRHKYDKDNIIQNRSKEKYSSIHQTNKMSNMTYTISSNNSPIMTNNKEEQDSIKDSIITDRDNNKAENKLDNNTIEKFDSYNQILVMSSLAKQTDSANINENNEQHISNDEIDDNNNNPFNEYNYLEFSNIFVSNDTNNNEKSEEDSNKPVDSGPEEMKFNFNSIFGSNIHLNINFNDNENTYNDNDLQEEKERDLLKPHFQAFNTLIRNQSGYSNPFTQKQSHGLTDLYESDEEINDNNEEEVEVEGVIKAKTYLIQAKDEYSDRDEEVPEWIEEVIDKKTVGYFDKSGEYRIQ